LGDPVKAVLSMGEDAIAADDCRPALRERCVEHAAFVYGAPYQRLTRPFGPSSGFAPQVVAVDDVALGGENLTASTIDFLKKKIPTDADWVAVWLDKPKKTQWKTHAKGDEAAFSMVGISSTSSAKSCQTKAGQVAIRGRSYDVNRWSTSMHHEVASTLSFSLPAEEARQLQLAEGERALVAFRARALRGFSSSPSSLGDARIVRVK